MEKETFRTAAFRILRCDHRGLSLSDLQFFKFATSTDNLNKGGFGKVSDGILLRKDFNRVHYNNIVVDLKDAVDFFFIF